MQSQPRKKSPRTPSIPLTKALEYALRVYDKERLHVVPEDAFAQAAGFKNASGGSASSSLAALRYFGMLERPKTGLFSITKAVEIFKFAPDQVVKNQVLLEFLKTPALYQELLTKYATGLPSSASLKYELIQKGFLPQTVDSVLSAFLESVSFTRYFASPNSDPVERPPAEVKEIEEPKNAVLPTAKNAVQSPLETSLDHERDQIPVRLSGGRKAWIVVPSPFYESDKARMKAQIDILFADLEVED